MTGDLKELARVFLKLGIIGFGGPAAHIALMESEIVKERRWLERSQFLDLWGATHLIPGPNSTEMAIHIGYVYAGFWGLIIAGSCFILPAVILTTILAIIYDQLGTLPQIVPLLAGIKPVVIIIILDALYRLAKKALKKPKFWLIIIFVILAIIVGLNEIVALFLGGILGMFWLKLSHQNTSGFPLLVLLTGSNINPIKTEDLSQPSLWKLGLFFLKVGSVLFGSGYVLIAFLQGELVEQYGWLTQQQLLDAIAIGQFTPGPILSTATFIGYLILGLPGAIIATIGIFLPSFLFVLILNPIVPKLRQSQWTSAFLDAINVSSVALMTVVTFNLLYQTLLISSDPFLLNWRSILIAILAGFALFKYRINVIALILGGAILGLVLPKL